MDSPTRNATILSQSKIKFRLKFTKFLFNFICRCSDQDVKRPRQDLPFDTDDSIFELLHSTESKATPNIEAPSQEASSARELDQNNPIVDDDDDQTSEAEPLKPSKNFPIDWSIKSRVRILSKTLVVNNNLKSSQEASGLTGFVRCLDIQSTSSGLDISDGARFHQNLMYWQYPHLPWLNLIQRNSSSNNQFKMNTPESESLLTDWKECFRNIFQLLRSRQCPFFYVLANQFTVLFRAAGIGGRCEMHALLTPTTRGFRKLLKDEDIDFTQPLKETVRDPSISLEKSKGNENKDPQAEDDDDDEDELQFLESLGVETSDIKFKEDVKARTKEIEDDNGDLSTTLIEGVDCQAFFNFLLKSNSIVPKVGRLAFIPPTLLAPVAFLGGTLRKQTARSSKLRLENEDFCSIELRGAILPHTIQTLCALLSEIKENYSLTMVNYPQTVAFTKTSRKLLEDLDTSQAVADHVFGRENLSDCGMGNAILESLCRVDGDAVNILERLRFSRENGGYTLF